MDGNLSMANSQTDMTEKQMAELGDIIMQQIEKIKLNDNIPTWQIWKDISETEKEIDNYEVELESLRKNPRENKLEIYMREGRILKRKDFIKDLKIIIEYRTQHPDDYAV